MSPVALVIHILFMIMEQTGNKKQKMAILFLVIFLIVGGLASYMVGRSNFKSNFRTFNSARISGEIVYLYHTKGGERFRLKNSATNYNFVSVMNALNNFSQFSMVAEIGDSVYKSSFSDTLFLFKVHPGEKIAFMLEKP